MMETVKHRKLENCKGDNFEDNFEDMTVLHELESKVVHISIQ